MREQRLFGLGPVFAPGIAWLALACAAGLALGLWGLDRPGLWCDEIYTARWTRLPLEGLVAALRTDLHPPLYFLAEHALVRRLGESEVTLRLLSVLAGVATVAASFWAFRPILSDRLSAAAAWFLVLSPEFLFYARMARYYAFAALIAIVAHGLFVRLALKRGRPRSWLLYGVFVALLLYTSYVSVCLVLAHGVWAIAARRRRPRLWQAWLLAAAGGFALFAPWLSALVAQAKTAHGLLAAVVSGPRGFALMLGYDLHAITASELLVPWSPLGAVGLLAGTALLLVGMLAAVRRGLGRSVLLPAASALFLAWLVVGLLAHATPFVGLPARTLFMWPFAAALMAVGALDPAQHRPFRWGATLLLLLAWLAAWGNLYGARGWLNPMYLTPGREVAADVERAARPGDAILAEDDTGANYYLERAGLGARLADPIDDARAESLLADPGVRRVWMIRLSRDGSARVRGSGGTEARLIAWGTKVNEAGYLEADPVLGALKRRLLKLPPHRHRIVLETWERSSAVPTGGTSDGGASVR